MLSKPEFNALFISELADIRIALVCILFTCKAVPLFDAYFDICGSWYRYNKRIKGVEWAPTISLDHILIILTAIGVPASLF